MEGRLGGVRGWKEGRDDLKMEGQVGRVRRWRAGWEG